MSIKPTHERMEELLENDDLESHVEKMRFGLAMLTMTALVWMSYVRIYAERALKQSARLLVSLTFLAVSVLMYRAVLAGYNHVVRRVVEEVVERATDNEDVDDRIGAVLGVLAGLACAYAAYRVGRWAIQPHIERVKMYEQMYGHDSLSVFDNDEDDEDDSTQEIER